MRDFVERCIRYLRYRLRRLLSSPRISFEVRARLRWWSQRVHWLFRRPQTFTEKMEWKRLKDRRALLTTFADKGAAREYVCQIVGPEVLTTCYALVEDPGEIVPGDLPREFVLKPTHSSGPVYIVADAPPGDGAPAGPVGLANSGIIFCDPDSLDWSELLATSREWLTRNYGEKHVEWAYRDVEPRILVEELLKQPQGGLPDNYRFFVFHGRTRFVQVDQLARSGWRRRHYLPDWTPVDVEFKFPSSPLPVPRPRELVEMVEIAERLSNETDFVRVDLYAIDGRLVFGELTNYPGGARAQMPRWLDVELGRWWRLPAAYR
jgi:hypothetical protein